MKNKLKIIIPVGISLIIIALAFVFIQFTPKAQTDVAAMIDKAYDFITEQNFEEAIAVFEKVIEIDPKNVDAYIGIAEAYEKKGDIDKAIEWLEKGYDITGSPLIAETLERLKKPAVQEENNEAEIMEEPIEDAAEDEIVVQEEELVKFVLPYKVNLSGSHNDIGGLQYYLVTGIDFYEDFVIDFYDDNYDFDYTYYTNESYESKDYTASTYSIYYQHNDWLKKSYGGLHPLNSESNSWEINCSIENRLNSMLANDNIVAMNGSAITKVLNYYYDSLLVKREFYYEDDIVKTVEFEYDDNGNAVKKIVDGSEINYKYDNNGNIIEEIYSSGVVWEYSYDENNNLVADYLNGECQAEYSYNDNGMLTGEYRDDYFLEYDYYENGALKYCLYGHADEYSCEIEYYSNGHQKKVYYQSEGKTHEDKYDEYGSIIECSLDQEDYESLETYDNTYDENGRLIKQVANHSWRNSNGSDTSSFTTYYTYDSAGRLLSEGGLSDEKVTSSRNEYEYNSDGLAVKDMFYMGDELEATAEVTEFIEVAIPKSFLDELMKYAK